ncbi:hypothetical protein NPIL_525221, partial [Nephila pilipes]
TTCTEPCRGLNPPFPKDLWSYQQHFCASSSQGKHTLVLQPLLHPICPGGQKCI